jgi:hypothetical protein
VPMMAPVSMVTASQMARICLSVADIDGVLFRENSPLPLGGQSPVYRVGRVEKNWP